MKYRAQYSSKFNKDFKKCIKRGHDMSLLRNVIHLLCETGTLPPQYHPHKLSGNFTGLWECHIKGDWLLVWKQNEKELILLFTDTGSHADLFG